MNKYEHGCVRNVCRLSLFSCSKLIIEPWEMHVR